MDGNTVHNTDEVISVIQIFRHGHKTPAITYPGDINPSDIYWPIEVGQLTKTGKRQMYDLGCYTRRRYNTLLSAQYSSKDVRLYSTNVDRTIMSIQLFAAGLYPPTEVEIWNEDLKWNPIPVRVADPCLLSMLPIVPHPNYVRMYDETLEKEVFSKNRDLLNHLYRHVGRTNLNMFDLILLYDKWDLERTSGLKLPEWVKECLPKVEEMAFDIAESCTRSEEFKRIIVGPFFSEMIDHFRKMSANPDLGPKLITYCGHDTNIFSFLDTLGVYKHLSNHRPPFGSSLLFELRKRNGEHFMNIFYKAEDELKPIPVGGSDFDIKIEEFEKHFRRIIVDKSVIKLEASAK